MPNGSASYCGGNSKQSKPVGEDNGSGMFFETDNFFFEKICDESDYSASCSRENSAVTGATSMFVPGDNLENVDVLPDDFDLFLQTVDLGDDFPTSLDTWHIDCV